MMLPFLVCALLSFFAFFSRLLLLDALFCWPTVSSTASTASTTATTATTATADTTRTQKRSEQKDACERAVEIFCCCSRRSRRRMRARARVRSPPVRTHDFWQRRQLATATMRRGARPDADMRPFFCSHARALFRQRAFIHAENSLLSARRPQRRVMRAVATTAVAIVAIVFVLAVVRSDTKN